jgi:hypothetical protein
MAGYLSACQNAAHQAQESMEHTDDTEKARHALRLLKRADKYIMMALTCRTCKLALACAEASAVSSSIVSSSSSCCCCCPAPGAASIQMRKQGVGVRRTTKKTNLERNWINYKKKV